MLRLGRRRRQAIVILLVASLGAVVPFVMLAWEAASDTESDLKAERLRLAELAAAQADRILTEAFFELELASALSPSYEEAGQESEGGPLRTLYGRATMFKAGILLLDGDGELVLAVPERETAGVERGLRAHLLAFSAAETDRSVSEPFVSVATGHATAALSVPLYDDSGQREGTLIGLMDLAEPLISGLVEPARFLGPAGHADLVDERGLVLASTEPQHVMTAGDHPAFYRRMAELRSPAIEKVRHEPSDIRGDQSRWHIMAYAPLRNAPWGIAIGASEESTLQTAREFRRNLIVFALVSLTVLLVGGVLVIRRIPA